MTAPRDRLLTVAGVALFVGVILGGIVMVLSVIPFYQGEIDKINAAHALDIASKDAEIAALEEARVYASDSWTIRGEASWYDLSSSGPITASGARFDETELTAAHKGLPFGSRWLIRNLRNGKTVEVTINDRGPYMGNRTWDLSRAAFEQIESLDAGLIHVEAKPVFRREE